MEYDALMECVPNFSEGRDATIILQIADAINAVDTVKVLHVDMGYDANRTVITFAGHPAYIQEAAFHAIKVAAELIDMSSQKGTHPRIGATDVMPIVPIANCTIEDAISISHKLSQQVADELNIPVYNYEQSAKTARRTKLENIRRGEYESLSAKLIDKDWLPDYSAPFNAKAGATVIGAREFLLAYNINLKTTDVKVAKEIAALIRESGSLVDGLRKTGYFKRVKAIGWDVPEYNMVQVSTNITDTNLVSLHQVFEKVKHLAIVRGIAVNGSELIGLTPKRCLLEAGHYFSSSAHTEEEIVLSAVRGLGLSSVVEFDPQNRIIEYLLS